MRGRQELTPFVKFLVTALVDADQAEAKADRKQHHTLQQSYEHRAVTLAAHLEHAGITYPKDTE